MFKFLKKGRIIAAELFADAFTYLSEKYAQSRDLLTPASPFTQILLVVAELGEMIFYYIEAAVSEMNIFTAKNIDNIWGKARLTGHNPTRGIAAQGKISLKLKAGAENNFDGNYIIIPKYTKLRCLNNGLSYIMLTDSDHLKIIKGDSNLIYSQIIQGDVESVSFISEGLKGESFSAQANAPIDHFHYNVTVNGVPYDIYDSIYDTTRDTEGCMVKTGINGGIDIYFGNGYFGKIPPRGGIIEVEYILTRGAAGNVPTTTATYFTFLDKGIDQYGEEVDLNENLLIGVVMPPSFGSDQEDPNFTRMIAPNASRSFVLANPSAYIYFLQKYGYFSHIDAYTTFDDEYLDDDNVIYIFAVPDIQKKIESNTNYFTVNEEEFILTDTEIEYIKKLLNDSNQQMVTAEVNFIKPKIKRYMLNIILRYFDNIEKSDIKTSINNALNEYFLNIKRKDKIPRSDITALIENIAGVDSVSVFFVSEENETAIRNGYYIKEVYGYDPVKKRREVIRTDQIQIEEGTDPMLGLDEFGDISILQGELPIIRGGWQDRNGSSIEVYPDDKKLSSLNIVFKDKISWDLYNRMNAQKIINIKNKLKA